MLKHNNIENNLNERIKIKNYFFLILVPYNSNL